MDKQVSSFLRVDPTELINAEELVVGLDVVVVVEGLHRKRLGETSGGHCGSCGAQLIDRDFGCDLHVLRQTTFASVVAHVLAAALLVSLLPLALPAPVLLLQFLS